VHIVRFDLDTWLRRYRAARPVKAGTEDDGQVWDPARVKSPALREALATLEAWAPLRVPVLLVGERGTGKTTLANFLRAMSPFQKGRSGGWPTAVCGQFRVNPELARSELFGHAKGAFTGSAADRKGLLEQADGETLFLDEIADIDRDTQRLLMAAIEGRGFQRLGETQLRQSSFRLVCATNRTLAELHAGVLDPDFFDRVAVFVLDVPPLRQCRDDLPAAWRRVLASATRTAGVAPPGWERWLDHPKVLEAIGSHSLPGNFRDLQRAAFHALAALRAGHPEAQVVDTAIAALGTRERADPAWSSAEDLGTLLPVVGGLRAQLDAHEGRWLQAALAKAGGNKSEAARLLGMPRKTFEHRLRSISKAR
jgi:DNA-binding NtrC family response regulator